MLHPTMTIVCRLETLEAPSLEPRCIGLSALRLCVDLLGMQPLSEVLSDGKPSCFFNAGQFMVPILYGTFPTDIQFATESKIQLACPHIDGAYLRMSINPLLPGERSGDKTPVATDSPYGASRKGMVPSQSSRAANYHASTMEFHRELNAAANLSVDPWSMPSRSVGAVLLKTYLASEKEIAPPPLSIPDVLLEKFRDSIIFDVGEKQEVRNRIVSWSQQRFDDQRAPGEAINQRYLLEYSETAGCNATLDMLYNMPDRKKLTQAAERAAHVAAMRSGLIRGWDSQMNYYKTIFRYLPGAIPPSPSRKEDEKDKSRDMKLVVDDASVRAVFESPEQCPAFCDDFSSTEGLRLGPNACLLVVVTAVDVLISRKAAQQKDKQSTSDLHGGSGEKDRDPSYLSPMNSKASIFSEDASTRIAEKKLKMTKLKGLKGIYVGAKDPRSTWWGIVPLFARFPNPLLSGADDAAHPGPVFNGSSMTAPSSAVDHGQSLESPGKMPPPTHQNSAKNTSNGSIPSAPQKGERDQSDFTTHMTDAGAGGVSNQPSSEESSPKNGGNNGLGIQPTSNTASSFLCSLVSSPVFVNSGTHQIPLFRGLPPEDMINSPDPMAWLINRIFLQLSRGPVTPSGLTSPVAMLLAPCLLCCQPSSVNDVVQQHRIPVVAEAGAGDGNEAKEKDKDQRGTLHQSASTMALLRAMSSRMDLANQQEAASSGKGHGKHGKKGKKAKKAKNVDIALSDGASALIRIVDPRVKRLAQHHAAITPSTVNNTIPGSFGSAKITSMVAAANAVRASLRVSQKYAAANGGFNSGGMGSPGLGGMGDGNGDGGNGNNGGGGHYHHPSVDGTTHSVSPTLLPVRNDIMEEVLLLHAHHVHEKGAPMTLDAARLRNLRQAFSLQPNKFIKKKNVKSAIPETMDAHYLIQEINTKFYEVISS